MLLKLVLSGKSVCMCVCVCACMCVCMCVCPEDIVTSNMM